MCKKAIYPGSFDPVTYGHIDIIRRASKVFEEIVVAVAKEVPKTPFFSLKERVKMLKKAMKNEAGVVVEPFDGLMVEFARRKHAEIIIRGLRMLSDFEYEFQMALTNRRLAPDLETVFLMPSEAYSYVSSRLLKEISKLGADLSHFVPPFVEEALRRKFRGSRK